MNNVVYDQPQIRMEVDCPRCGESVDVAITLGIESRPWTLEQIGAYAAQACNCPGPTTFIGGPANGHKTIIGQPVTYTVMDDGREYIYARMDRVRFDNDATPWIVPSTGAVPSNIYLLIGAV